MPSRSNSNKFDYGDKYRALGVSQDTYRTVPTMTQWCKRQDWFDNKLMFKGSANGSKGTIKKRLNLMSQIKTSCGTRMRSLRQTLSTFIDQIGNASPEDQSKWLCSYDELSPWYRYDMVLVRVLLLRLHGLKKLHKRVISQRDAIQNAFRNKSLGFGDMRVPASLEFKIATTIAEHLRLVVRVKSEAVVYTKNAALINADPFSADYEIGPWNNCYENYSRLPRSGEQIQVLKDQNNFKKCETVFFFRSDLFKMQKAMDPEKWNTLVSLWRKWNILQFMPSYLAAFFPGNESAAKEIGLVSEDIVDAASLLQKEEDDDDEKDDDGDLNII
eukprot:56988_1